MEGLLSELDYFEPNVMQLNVIGDYDCYRTPSQPGEADGAYAKET